MVAEEPEEVLRRATRLRGPRSRGARRRVEDRAASADEPEVGETVHVAGAKEQGFFNGMKKLGVITFQCYPEYNDQLLGALSRAGFRSNTIETFDYGCPPGGIPGCSPRRG